ncbi:hypothetical protein OROMI_030027 [Orobanche minor]
MEGKGLRSVIMGLFILSLVVAPIGAIRPCCKNTAGARCYNSCRAQEGSAMSICAAGCSCTTVSGNICLPNYPVYP